MKQQLQKIAAIAIIILVNALASVYAQTATWPLTADQGPSITGSGISAAPQGLAGLAIGNYAGLAGPLSVTSQRVRVSSGWPLGSTYDAARYFDYSLTVTSGSFNSVNVSIPVAAAATNNLRLDIFYSTNNFATSTQLNLGGAIALSQTAFQTLVYSFNKVIATGTTFSIRVFPWYTGSDLSTSRYVLTQNLQIALSTATVPLKLSSFNASLADSKAKLSWNTSNEINMQGFDVEKAIDGKPFSSIATIAAKNATTNSYSFTDDKAVTVKTFYRLKMMDKDGSNSYSQVLSVTGKSSAQLSVYPNPVVNSIVLSHPQASANAAIKIVSIDGKNTLQRKVQEAATQSSFDVSELVKGTYIVQYLDGSISSSIQFIKQ